MKKILSVKSFLLLSFLLFSACDGSLSHLAPQMPEGNVSLMTLKQSSLTSVADHLTGTLTIYSSPGNKKLDSKKLSITQNGNGEIVVSTTPMTLERSTPYRFIAIFYWDDVAIAYVDTTQATENDDSTTITYSENMIVTTTSTSSTDKDLISADVSAGFLPDLDEDDDGYTNFIEIRCKTKPTDDSDYPRGPKITNFKAKKQSDGLTLKITADIFDGLGVKSANLSFTNATHLSELLTESLDGEDGDVTRHYTGTVMPQNAGVTTLNLFLHTVDDEDQYKNASDDVDITDLINSSKNIGPVVHFSNLLKGEVVSGKIPLEFQVSDKDGVKSFELIAPDINNTNFPDGITQNNEAHTFYGEWDTSAQVSGPFTVRVVAEDNKGEKTTQDLAITISQASTEVLPSVSLKVYPYQEPENLISYLEGKTIDGNVEITVSAKHPSGMDLLELKSGDLPNGAMLDANAKPTTATTYVNVINTTKLSDGKITLTFHAKDGTGQHDVTRDFNLMVQNYPTITSFTANDSAIANLTNIIGQNVEFNWNTTNADRYKITHDGIDILTGTTGISAIAEIFTSGTYTLTLINDTNNGSFETNASIIINVDDDGDGVNNELDNCKENINAEQADNELDGMGDVCDDDDDNDGVLDVADNCIFISNADQADNDKDGFSDACDDDDDNDGVLDRFDEFPMDATETSDDDGDYVGNGVDNCAHAPNPDQSDLDGDTFGDLCDNDRNADGIIDVFSLYQKSYKMTGETSGDLTGSLVSSVGDINQDGYDDFIISSKKANNNTGVVYLIYGKNNLANIADMDLSMASAKFVGENSGDFAGVTVSTAGDINGDGYDDILIGADQNGNGAGAVYLIFGKEGLFNGIISLADADVKFTGLGIGNRAGRAMANIGDIDSDGYDDILISTNYPPKLYLIQGSYFAKKSKFVIYNMANAAFIQISGFTLEVLASAGDVNNDGYGDFLIALDGDQTMHNNSGALYLIYGKADFFSGSFNLTASLGAEFVGEKSGDGLGLAVAGSGDVNGDGYDDILVSSKYAAEDQVGVTYLIYGKESLFVGINNIATVANTKFIGENSYDTAGAALSNSGDLNHDGYDDILIGAPNELSGRDLPYVDSSGAFYVIYGKSDPLNSVIDLSSSDAKFIGNNSADSIGFSISGGGDFNGDGYDDVLVGAPINDINGEYAGAAYLVLSPNVP